MTIPAPPRTIPIGSTDPELIAEALRDLRQYVLQLPTVEHVSFQGVVTLPMELAVDTPRPFFVALTGRPDPDNNEPVVEVLGLTFSWQAEAGGGAVVSIESMDGVAEGDSVTLHGVVVGERN